MASSPSPPHPGNIRIERSIPEARIAELGIRFWPKSVKSFSPSLSICLFVFVFGSVIIELTYRDIDTI
jgi:hypothetical protein